MGPVPNSLPSATAERGKSPPLLHFPRLLLNQNFENLPSKQGVPGSASRQQRLAVQAVLLEPGQQFDLVLLVAAGDQDQELLGVGLEVAGQVGVRGLQQSVGAGLPGGAQLGGVGWRDLQQA